MKRTSLPQVAINLNWLMEKAGTNPNALANELARLGTPVPQATIFRILTGESRDPRSSSLSPIADYFGLTPASLRYDDLPLIASEIRSEGGGGGKSEVEAVADRLMEPVIESLSKRTRMPGERLGREDVTPLPYFSGTGRLERGTVFFESPPEGYLVKEAAFFAKYDVPADEIIAISADGNSNADFIVDGDIAFFDRRRTEPRSGKMFLIDHPDGLLIKTLRRRIDGSWVLESRNPDKASYPDEAIPPAHADLLRICGEFFYRQGG